VRSFVFATTVVSSVSPDCFRRDLAVGLHKIDDLIHDSPFAPTSRLSTSQPECESQGSTSRSQPLAYAFRVSLARKNAERTQIDSQLEQWPRLRRSGTARNPSHPPPEQRKRRGTHIKLRPVRPDDNHQSTTQWMRPLMIVKAGKGGRGWSEVRVKPWGFLHFVQSSHGHPAGNTSPLPVWD